MLILLVHKLTASSSPKLNLWLISQCCNNNTSKNCNRSFIKNKNEKKEQNPRYYYSEFFSYFHSYYYVFVVEVFRVPNQHLSTFSVQIVLIIDGPKV